MGLNFPAAPAVGTLYPQPPLPGVPVYKWDGTTWGQGGGVVSAAPLDALAYNGLQINGTLELYQAHNGGALTVGYNAVPNFNAFLADMFSVIGAVQGGGMNVNTGRQIAGGSILSTVPFPAAIFIQTNNTAYAQGALTNGDYAGFRTAVEGYRMARLNWGTASAVPLSYGFQFYAAVAGTVLVRAINLALTRAYYNEHPVVVGWNWVTGTFPGDVTGVWQKTTSIGLYFDIFIAGKAASPAVPGAWGGTLVSQSTGSTNFLPASPNYCALANVIMLPGSQVPSATRAQLIMRPTSEEIALCGRYYEKSYALGDLVASTSTNGYELDYVNVAGSVQHAQVHRFLHKKRVAPTVSIYSMLSGAGGTVYNIGSAGDTIPSNIDGISEQSFRLIAVVTTGYYVQWVADARLI